MLKRCLLFLLATRLAVAEPLSLESAVREALSSSPTLGRLQARVTETREKLHEVARGGNPRLELQARYSYLNPSLGFAGLPLIVPHNYSAGLVLEQAVATFGRLHWSTQAAELQLRAVEQELERERERIALSALLAYSRLQTTGEAIAVAQEAVTARERLLQDLQARLKRGVSARYEVLVAEVALAQDQQRLLQARQQNRLALAQLQVLLGWTRERSPEPQPLSSTLFSETKLPSAFPSAGVTVAVAEIGPSLEKALQQRSELRALDFAIQAAEARVQLERSQGNPTLGLQSRYELRNTTAFQTPNQWSAGVELRWPLFDGGLSAARSAQAEAARVQLSEGRRELERQIRLEVEEAVLRWHNSAQSLQVAERSLLAAQEAGRLTRLRFQAEMGTHQEVLDAQARLREAQQAQLEAVQGGREAEWQLRYAVGDTLIVP